MTYETRARRSRKLVDIRKSRMCYRYLLISVTVILVTGILNFLLTEMGLGRDAMAALDSLSWLIVGFCGLMYLVFIAALAAENHKNPVLWLLLAMFFAPFGTIISFFMVRSLGKKNGWL